MRLSPIDIRQQQFSMKTFRGFDPQEVDTFLDDVANEFEALLRENVALREQLASHEERSRGISETEKTLKDTLLATQRVAEEMKEGARRDALLQQENAKRDAQLLLREATANGEKLMEEARAEEAKLRVEIQALKRARRQLIEEFRAVVDRYDRGLADDLGDAEPQR